VLSLKNISVLIIIISLPPLHIRPAFPSASARLSSRALIDILGSRFWPRLQSVSIWKGARQLDSVTFHHMYFRLSSVEVLSEVFRASTDFAVSMERRKML
jgi:hypothetical protein